MTLRHCLLPSVIVLLAGCPLHPAQAGISEAAAVVNPANGHAYHVRDDMLTWAEAEAWAVSLGGHLVSINDAGEDAWLRANLPLSPGYYWLGADDAAVEGSFAWVTGELFAYQNFLPGEPDDNASSGGNGDYLALSVVDMAWLDTDGSFVGLVTGAIAEVSAVSGVDDLDPVGADIRFEASPTVAESFVALRFAMPKAGAVRCEVFDVRGRHVRTIAVRAFEAGGHELGWDARDDGARRVQSGLYLVRLEVGERSRTVKIVIAR